METLSDRLNTLRYEGEVKYGDLYHTGRANKHIEVSIRRKEKESSAPNPYGDDDYATPQEDEERMDIIGQNGNDGLHYDEEPNEPLEENDPRPYKK